MPTGTSHEDVDSPQRRFARATWAGLSVERELHFAEALAIVAGDDLASVDLDRVEQVAAHLGDETPVGAVEIAARLGVSRATVDEWRQPRRNLLPPPDWTVGGRPAWRWSTVARWATTTGRL